MEVRFRERQFRFTPTCVGKTYPKRTPCPSPRFTPTCVGKTRLHLHDNQLHTVHPHMRGEDVDREQTSDPEVGSPPHAWGRLVGGFHYLIPSGSPPHAWGRLNLVCRPMTDNGSPPHAWGRRRQLLPEGLSERFTPTCVGKTLEFRIWVSLTSYLVSPLQGWRVGHRRC